MTLTEDDDRALREFLLVEWFATVSIQFIEKVVLCNTLRDAHRCSELELRSFACQAYGVELYMS